MNGKILICLALVLALFVIGAFGGFVGSSNTQCKIFISSGTSYTCPGGGNVGPVAGSRVCEKPASSARTCYRGNKDHCPGGFPDTVADMSCFECCCSCNDPDITDYAECCAESD